MTRQRLVLDDHGIYRASLEEDLESSMRPAEKRHDLRLTAKAVGYFIATVLAGIGVLIGLLVVICFAACFWCLGQAWGARR